MLTPSHLDRNEKVKPRAKLEHSDRSGYYLYSFEPELTADQAKTLATECRIGGNDWGLAYRSKVKVTPAGETGVDNECILRIPSNWGLSRVLDLFKRINNSGLAEISRTTENYPIDQSVFTRIDIGSRLRAHVAMDASHQIMPDDSGFVVVNPDGVTTGFIHIDLPSDSSMLGALHTLRGQLSKMVYVDIDGKTVVVEQLF